MTSTRAALVERVARAMALANGRDPDAEIPGDVRTFSTEPIDWSLQVVDMLVYGPAWKAYSRNAEAAIRAVLLGVREPSEKQLKAAFVAMNNTPSGTWKRMKTEGTDPRRMFDVKMEPRYRAMIDALLAEIGG